jgi:hypothetical protein
MNFTHKYEGDPVPMNLNIKNPPLPQSARRYDKRARHSTSSPWPAPLPVETFHRVTLVAPPLVAQQLPRSARLPRSAQLPRSALR